MTQVSRSGESGASMIFIAASIFVLIGVAALVVDLSGLRLDRAIDQRVTDAAATAGAIAVFESDGRVGCQTALGYLALNAPEIGESTFVGYPCSSIPTTCSAGDPASIETTTVGRFTISVVHPVPDGHPLMTSAALGAPGQSVTAGDLDQCDRIGVEVAADRNTTFGQVLGSDQNRTVVHSVGVAYRGTTAQAPINLLLLDRTACQAMRASGNGGIIVNAIVDPPNTYPGLGASDSDGSTCTPPDEGVIYKQGFPSILRADGPPGCPGDVSGTGEGCGILQALAVASVPGSCTFPLCQSDGPPAVQPRPIPTTMSSRITRQPIDHRYNCHADYVTPPAAVTWASGALTAPNYDIAGCTGAPAHVYNLIASVGETGLPTGFNSWVSTYGPSCETLPGTTLTINGDWHVECADFNVKGTLRIHGDVVFDGNVNVTSSTGHLLVDNPPGSPQDGQGYAFFRNGTLTKDGRASLTFDHTFVYFSQKATPAPSSGYKIDLSGGDAAATDFLSWVAPTKGPFEDLALWSDSPLDHVWSGQAGLVMEGTFFVPWARVQYAGLSTQNQTDAQFVAGRLWARGNSALVLSPKVGRSTPVDTPIVAELIR